MVRKQENKVKRKGNMKREKIRRKVQKMERRKGKMKRERTIGKDGKKEMEYYK